MHNIFRLAIVIASASCASIASAQQNVNPMGMDLGSFHTFVSSPLPSQVTTYEPPSTTPRRAYRYARVHRSAHLPRYALRHRHAVRMAASAN